MTRTILACLAVAVILGAARTQPPRQGDGGPRPLVFSKGQAVQWTTDDHTPNGALIDGAFFLKQSGFRDAWKFDAAITRRGGRRVWVALLDLGFGEHDQLRARWQGASPDVVQPVDRLDAENLWRAESGTFAAGIIAAEGARGVTGCTRFADLVPIPVAAVDGKSNPKSRLPSLAVALRELEAQIVAGRVQVVHVGVVANYRFRLPTDGERKAIEDTAGEVAGVIDRAAERGVVFVSPAGNDSYGDRQVDACWANPINYLGLKSVGGRGPRKNVLVIESVNRAGDRSAFSNAGGHLSALGEDVMGLALNPTRGGPAVAVYDVRSGTGMASAQVAALVANMLAYKPELRPADIAHHLGGRDPDRSLPSPTHGRPAAPAPRVNAFDAMLKCRDSSWTDLADLNHDGKVDRSDFARLKDAVRAADPKARPAHPREDLNGDGLVSHEKTFSIWNPKLQRYLSVTDVQVMAEVWEDPTFAPARELAARLRRP